MYNFLMKLPRFWHRFHQLCHLAVRFPGRVTVGAGPGLRKTLVGRPPFSVGGGRVTLRRAAIALAAGWLAVAAQPALATDLLDAWRAAQQNGRSDRHEGPADQARNAPARRLVHSRPQ